MRKIKFRVWDLLLEQYNHDAQSHFLWDCFISIPERYCPEQYTGLKDKNGVEIYEGDIVKSEQEKHYWMSVISSESGLGGVNLYAMEFCNNVSVSDCGGFYTYERQLSVRRNNIHSRMEVIGNIHENPELID